MKINRRGVRMATDSKKVPRPSEEHVRVQSHPIEKYLKTSAAKELAKPPKFPQLVSSGK
jgi:hypothetical protein